MIVCADVRAKPRTPPMDVFAPEFARHCLSDCPEDAAGTAQPEIALEEETEEAALEDLAERVHAARLVR